MTTGLYYITLRVSLMYDYRADIHGNNFEDAVAAVAVIRSHNDITSRMFSVLPRSIKQQLKAILLMRNRSGTSWSKLSAELIHRLNLHGESRVPNKSSKLVTACVRTIFIQKIARLGML